VITIQLETTNDISREDFKVDATLTNKDGQIFKKMRVLKVDSEKKTLDVMFGGGPSGDY